MPSKPIDRDVLADVLDQQMAWAAHAAGEGSKGPTAL